MMANVILLWCQFWNFWCWKIGAWFDVRTGKVCICHEGKSSIKFQIPQIHCCIMLMIVMLIFKCQLVLSLSYHRAYWGIKSPLFQGGGIEVWALTQLDESHSKPFSNMTVEVMYCHCAKCHPRNMTRFRKRSSDKSCWKVQLG